MIEKIQKLAGELFDAMVRRERHDGETFISLAEGSPKWMREVAHEAHGDMLPDDYRYEFIKEAAGAIHDASGDDIQDEARESMEEPESMNSELLKWASSSGYRFNGYCDDALRELSPDSFMGIVQYAQSLERREVFDLLWDALEKQVEESEEDE